MNRTRSGLVGLGVAALLLGAAGQRLATQTAPPPRVALPAPRTEGEVSLEAAIQGRRSVREFAPTPLTRQEIGQLAWAAQGITDPAGRLRAAPSAGALYPLELYLATPDGLYHYLPEGHALEVLADRDLRPAFQTAAGGQGTITSAPLVVLIAAVYERTAARFGDQAERYVHLEAGHVAENLLLQAVALGLAGVPIGGLREAEASQALALPADHQPLYIVAIGHRAGERD